MIYKKKRKEKKVFTLFSNQRAARGFNSFSKFGPLSEKFAHLWSSIFQSLGTISFVLFY